MLECWTLSTGSSWVPVGPSSSQWTMLSKWGVFSASEGVVVPYILGKVSPAEVGLTLSS